LLERWCTSEKVANSYDSLRQLILLEEFKNSVYPEVKTYINKQKADTLDKAARMADDHLKDKYHMLCLSEHIVGE
jgi:hypothetical protein